MQHFSEEIVRQKIKLKNVSKDPKRTQDESSVSLLTDSGNVFEVSLKSYDCVKFL